MALTLHPYPALKVVIAGGPVRPSDGAVVGSAAVDVIRQFKVDSAIIGASAIDEDGTLLDFDPLEATVARAIIENARRVLLVCDATKVARAARSGSATWRRSTLSSLTVSAPIGCARSAPKIASR